MRKAEFETIENPILVNIEGLQNMCQCGRPLAIKLAKDAGAVIKVGRSLRFNVKKLQEYIDTISSSIMDEKE